MARVLIGGDICPIGDNTPFFERGDAESLFHDLLDEFRNADLVLANLECPLIEHPTPIAKTGPVFGESVDCIKAIRAAGIHVLCLANNHILDHGAAGLASTIAACDEAGIATVGAGADVASARRIVVQVATDGMRIGILAMAEREFSVATTATAGANPLDLIDYVRNVQANRGSIDYLIVLLHGGAEFLQAPSPRLQEACRFLIETGANAVVVQHPHSFGGYEHYRGGHIVYGQGALVMDEPIYRDRRSFHEGVLVALSIDAGGSSSMELIPFEQSDPVPGARKMEAHPAAVLLETLATKARQVLDPDYVALEWRRFCEEHKHQYLSVLLAHNRIVRRANRKGHFSGWLYRGRRLLGTRNVVSCEPHREAVETIFRERLV